jgi:hypothetical protein
MATTIKKMNKALYAAAWHLTEAGKNMSNVEEFRIDAANLMKMADELLAIIVPEEEKVSEDKMMNILDEILGDTK